MRKRLIWMGLAATMMLRAGDAPVLVELFTSEGCSSCPPADLVLQKLDQLQPVAGAQAIVLSEHVDYWNHIGWTDPYSSAAFSARQEAYARRLGVDGPYTPQMIVDGHTEFVGSDARAAQAAIHNASRDAKVGVRLTAAAGGKVSLEVDPLGAGKGHKATVYVAFAENSAVSDVLRGENKGRTLHHVAIVRKLQPVGTVSEQSGLRTEIPAGMAGARVIAFVQEAGNGKVWGAAMLPAR